MTKKILIVTASEVKNLELAQKFQDQLKLLGNEALILRIVELNLPLYNSAADANHNAKDLLGKWLPELQAAQGFVFLAPEYNGSTPPVFNNFLAWVSRSSKDWRECFNNKTAAIGTFSGGGGQHVLTSMRSQLAFIGMNVLGRQVLAHSSKPADDLVIKGICQSLVKHAEP